MKAKDKKLTTVRIAPDLWQDFKFECVRDKFTFQKLAERSIYLYLKDKDFREKMQKLTNIDKD